MSDSTSKPSSTDTGSKAKDGQAKGNGPELVSAEPGTTQYDKTGDAPAVDTQRVEGSDSYFQPASADEYNLAHRVSENDPNYVEAARKLDPEAVPGATGAADIEPRQE